MRVKSLLHGFDFNFVVSYRSKRRSTCVSQPLTARFLRPGAGGDQPSLAQNNNSAKVALATSGCTGSAVFLKFSRVQLLRSVQSWIRWTADSWCSFLTITAGRKHDLVHYFLKLVTPYGSLSSLANKSSVNCPGTCARSHQHCLAQQDILALCS